MMPLRILPAIILLLTLGGGGAPLWGATAIEQTAALLQRLQQRVASLKVDLGESRRDQETIRADLAELEAEVERLNDRLSALNRTGQRLNRELSGARTELKKTEKRLNEREEQLVLRLRALYRWQRLGPAALLFADKPLPQRAAEASMLARVAEADRELIRAVRDDREAQAREVERVERLSQEHEENRRQVARTRDQVRTAGTLKQELLAAEQRRARNLEGDLKLLEQREKELARLMEQLKLQVPAKKPAVSFASRKGKLPRPVAGKVITPYGSSYTPGKKGAYLSKGIRIDTTDAAAVRAVAAGRVAYTGTLPGYGNLVILDHGEGYYTLYAELGEIGVQVKHPVEAGEGVGTTGRSGSSTLYFEIRHHSGTEDPARWLVRKGA